MLKQFDVQEQLSQAFLYMVATCARCTCIQAPRTLDNEGVDAIVRFQLDLPEENETEIDSLPIEVQLKSTQAGLTKTEKGISFSIKSRCYNRFRRTNVMAQRLIVLLDLPSDKDKWVTLEPEGLLSRNCAYWVSLRGAPRIDGQGDITIYFPEKNTLSPSALQTIIEKLSSGKMISYVD